MTGLIWTAGGAVILAAETVTASRGLSDGVIVALIGMVGLIVSTWIGTSRRGRTLRDDEEAVDRDELDRLRALDRHHRKHD